MSVRAIHGDMLDVIPRLVAEGVVVDSVCTDPPYNLTATAARFGKNGSAPAKFGKDGAHSRVARGFMNSAWDTDIAFRAETWETIGTILRPGSFVVAFGGTRTVHRLACAIEDAGFIIQDSILDLIASDARVQRFVSTLSPAQVDAFSQILDALQPTGALAWCFGTGFPKRRDALKPSFEPIVLAYKPGGKRTMGIDECRVVASSADVKAARVPQPAFNSPTGHVYGFKTGEGRNGETFDMSKGRWPANLCHDGSDEVVGLFPQSAGMKPALLRRGATTGRGMGFKGNGAQEPIEAGYGDSGSAARFFFSAKQYPRCALCDWPYDADGDIINPCIYASNAEASSAQPDIIKSHGSAHSDVLACIRQDGADRRNQSRDLASNAGNYSPQCHRLIASTAPENASDWPLEKIVQNVKAAASLCGSCATAIAQGLAASRQGHVQEQLPGPASISETSRQILTRSLALYVAGRENTDTILTTPSLNELFGSVFHAIAENTNSERSADRANIAPAQTRLHYSSKAGADDRWGSRHPTIKPVELMKWLVKLVTPPDGLVLDPFAGSGTTGVAALGTGRNAILIEREEQYYNDIRERLAFYEGGGLHSTQAKARSRKVELGPLFAEAAE